ncbi:MAG: hypothetical protein OXI53_05340 [Nitrospira sp.]|nr:hypothetical protein [Nitrospira sp.]MDE0505640.1 hypothetical protein [Candidatus Poribacteria bacterium]
MDNKKNILPPYEANRTIPLEETWITDIEGQSVRTPVRVMLRLLPQPKLVVEFDDFSEVTDHMFKEKCSISVENGRRVEMTFVRVTCAATIHGAFSPVEQPCTILDGGSPLQSVQFSILNFPEFLGMQNQSIEVNGERQLCGVAQLKATPWSITITATPNLSKKLETLKKDGGYALTHTGIIERSDSGTF